MFIMLLRVFLAHFELSGSLSADRVLRLWIYCLSGLALEVGAKPGLGGGQGMQLDHLAEQLKLVV